MSVGSTKNAFARVIADCKINNQVSIHSLRHAYATHLIEVGLNLRGVQELLGHSCPQTTACYVHMTDYFPVCLFAKANKLALTVGCSLMI